jgi:hypothetical protein
MRMGVRSAYESMVTDQTRKDRAFALDHVNVQDCPDRAVVVSVPPPDPRAVKMAHHLPGQADVQSSLSGRQRRWSRAEPKKTFRA